MIVYFSPPREGDNFEKNRDGLTMHLFCRDRHG